METHSIVELLHSLAGQARADELMYRDAAAEADGLSLIAFSISCSTLCRNRAAELDAVTRQYVADYKPSSTFAVGLRRAWKSLTCLIHPRNDRRIIDDCIFHQETSRRAYPRSMHLELPGVLRTALQNDMAAIDHCITGLHHLRLHGRQRVHPSDRGSAQPTFRQPYSGDN